MYVRLFDPLPPHYYVHVISDRWLGSQTSLPISFRHLIPPEKYPPPTELLDLQPLPVSALGNSVFENIFKAAGVTIFNPIQTQGILIEFLKILLVLVFRTVYENSDNVLVAAPNGSGKTVCAELAIMRHFANNPDTKCVYVSPVEDIATKVYADWVQRLGPALDVTVCLLTGEPSTDLKLLQRAKLIIATPERFFL